MLELSFVGSFTLTEYDVLRCVSGIGWRRMTDRGLPRPPASYSAVKGLKGIPSEDASWPENVESSCVSLSICRLHMVVLW